LRTYKCSPPTITIGSIYPGDGFEIMGSDTLTITGPQIYSYTNNTSVQKTISIIIPSFETDNNSLYKYGMAPFRYISLRAISGDIVLNDLQFSYCECS
jgi:hypothetical protein